MDLTTALDYARARDHGVLATLKGDGRPQLSNVNHAVDDDGIVRVSITADRAKYRNLVRDPRVSYHLTAEDFWSYVVLEGDAEMSAPAAAGDDATVEELIALYRAVQGEHPDWDDYRRAMVADGRVVLRILPERAYGMT